jgi:hypothetical protein
VLVAILNTGTYQWPDTGFDLTVEHTKSYTTWLKINTSLTELHIAKIAVTTEHKVFSACSSCCLVAAPMAKASIPLFPNCPRPQQPACHFSQLQLSTELNWTSPRLMACADRTEKNSSIIVCFRVPGRTTCPQSCSLCPLQHCGRGFESHWRHGCLCVFCVRLFCVYIVSGETANRPKKRLTRTYHWISFFKSYIHSAN